ncbi:hypothetical protein LNV09_15595 [Paucibacter sp. B2R-40]|uniref:hypothetical protein n=1 Tax=Paucibacter sp. B2R-40 TaxID=2893554 RepID=UPI0021E4D739|nr:hypothetical protein [Paucibacter sp. B2R-40]MCV2355569.1 hypothetical protein [Paucibacter sp. B2R-40]
MSSFSAQQIDAFVASIEQWRSAYHRARLHFVAVESGPHLLIVAARILLLAIGDETPKRSFRAGRIVAGEWELPSATDGLEEVLAALMSAEGFGVLVMTREGLVRTLDQIPFYPDADTLFERGVEAANDKQQKRKAVLAGQPVQEGLVASLVGSGQTHTEQI